jgi:hypothetical protein
MSPLFFFCHVQSLFIALAIDFSSCVLNYRRALNLSLLRNIRQFFLQLPSGNCPSTGNVLTGMVAVPGLCRVAEGRTKNSRVLRLEGYRFPAHRWLAVNCLVAHDRGDICRLADVFLPFWFS